MDVGIETHRAELTAYAWRLVGRREDAQDCVQSAFVKYLKLPEPPDHPRAWLYRVVHNLAVDLTRERRPAPPAGRFSPPADAGPESAEALERLLDRLDDDSRWILLLRYTHGFSFDEVAAIVSRPAGTVKVMAGRALTALRQLLVKP